MAKTPVMTMLRRAARRAREMNRRGLTDPADLQDQLLNARQSRRRFLRTAALGTAALATGVGLSGCTRSRQRPFRDGDATIAVIGAGLAGLSAALDLSSAGFNVQVYEASDRTGGRTFSRGNIISDEAVTELGGEFIDTGHRHMHALVKEFNLQLLDVHSATEAQLISDAFFFEGQHHSEEEVIEHLLPLIPQLQKDYDAIGDEVSYRDDGGAKALDQLSLAAYFDRLGISGWFRSMLDVAFVTEYGLETSEQSALNFLFLIGMTTEDGFKPFGDSDERFKVAGGNERVAKELAAFYGKPIQLQHRLVSVADDGTRVTLVFDANGTTVEAQADAVVLAIPFSILRDVEIRAVMPAVKLRAIRELGYGTNSKVFLGFRERIWRDQGYGGNVFTDERLQLAWDNTRLQPGTPGGITVYHGGKLGENAPSPDLRSETGQYLALLDKIWPGIGKLSNGRRNRMHWPTYPYSKGSYSCYKPGQWTSIGGAEGETVGNLYFAGEHCSVDHQGYMEGAVETGIAAARAIRERAGVAARWCPECFE